jgi:phage terminase large subunit-like protein
VSRYVTVDTAMKTGTHNDYSVIMEWGVDAWQNGRVYLLSMERGKWEAPELLSRLTNYYMRRGSVAGLPPLRCMYIEDKSSGTCMIQNLRQGGVNLTGESRAYGVPKIPVVEVQRGNTILGENHGSKEVRARAVAPLVEAGVLWFPMRASSEAPTEMVDAAVGDHIDAVIAEMINFPKAKHDDCVDAIIDALHYRDNVAPVTQYNNKDENSLSAKFKAFNEKKNVKQFT